MMDHALPKRRIHAPSLSLKPIFRSRVPVIRRANEEFTMVWTTSPSLRTENPAIRLARRGTRRVGRALITLSKIGDPSIPANRTKGRGKAAAAKAEKERKRERTARIARRVGSAVGGPVERRIERALLTKSWEHASRSALRGYLVSSLQNPVINVQSVLARHHFVRELYGDQFAGLMAEELQWASDTNQHLRRRQHALPGETGLTWAEVKRRKIWDSEIAAAIGDPERFAARWREALSTPPGTRLSVIEAACGSANDYRAFAAYGVGAHLDYTGFDLTEANVANAREMFPDVDFRRGDVQDIPAADGSYDWAMTSDLLEHLSPQACNRAIDELCRVSRAGVIIIFFIMSDVEEHTVTPRRSYHVNELSMERIRDRFVGQGLTPEFVHISGMLKERFGFDDYYNRRAWSMVARH
jgi:SAM-dependent methyltransferase